jgi:HSP20 family protein
MLPILRKVNIDPFSHNNSWHSLNRLFNDVLSEDLVDATAPGYLDMYEDQNNLYVEVELPGFNREEIKLTIEDGILHLEAKHQTESSTKDATYYIRERSQNRWARTLHLPVAVEEDKVNALFQDGILKVTLAKPEKTKPHNIKID